jgi:hypothetical protein
LLSHLFLEPKISQILKLFYFLTGTRKNFSQLELTKNYSTVRCTFFSKNCHQAFKHIALGIREPIPGSRIPDPGVKKALDPQRLFLSQNSRTKTEKLAEKLRAARSEQEKLEDNYRIRNTYFYLQILGRRRKVGGEVARSALRTGEAGGQLPGPNNLFLSQNSRTKTEKLAEKLRAARSEQEKPEDN